MFIESIIYYTCFSLFVIMCVLLLLPIWLLVTKALTYIISDTIGLCIALVIIIGSPFFVYSQLSKEFEQSRINFKKDFFTELYKKEICPKTVFPYTINSSITYEVSICFPKETKMRLYAEKIYNEKKAGLISNCIEKANPRYKYRCESVIKEFFNGMLSVDLRNSTIGDMLMQGYARYYRYEETTREGVYY